jgi:hypothetical protein
VADVEVKVKIDEGVGGPVLGHRDPAAGQLAQPAGELLAHAGQLLQEAGVLLRRRLLALDRGVRVLPLAAACVPISCNPEFFKSRVGLNSRRKLFTYVGTNFALKNLASGSDVMIIKIFLPKILAKKLLKLQLVFAKI